MPAQHSIRRFRRRSLPGPAHEVPGIGTVLALINTGQGAYERPFVHFVVRIEADGLDTYDATVSTEVPRDLLRLLGPGARLAVRVDPFDLDRPSADLSRLWITPAVVPA